MVDPERLRKQLLAGALNTGSQRPRLRGKVLRLIPRIRLGKWLPGHKDRRHRGQARRVCQPKARRLHGPLLGPQIQVPC